jgi:hypothetical protein
MDQTSERPAPTPLRAAPTRRHLKAAASRSGPRCFQIVRHIDVSGVSGTGVVAEGVEWSDGTVTLRWRGRYPTTTVWQDGVDALIAVHGHDGASTIRWLDTATEQPK